MLSLQRISPFFVVVGILERNPSTEKKNLVEWSLWRDGHRMLEIVEYGEKGLAQIVFSGSLAVMDPTIYVSRNKEGLIS